MTNEHAARPRRIWEGGAALIFGRSLSRAYNGWGIVEPFNDNRGGGDCGIINTHMGKRLLERNQSTKGYSGKACGITGEACGIGKAFALYAAEKGMRLALIDIDDRVEDVRKECEAAGSPKAIAIKVDVSEYEQVRMSVKRIMDEFGQIDVFFSNAGVGGAGTLGNIPPQDWDWITSVNFLAMAYYATEIVPIMKKQGTEAHFLLTGSIGSLQPGMRIQSAYTASKHAALSLAESIRDYADHFAPYIGVTAFCPMYVNTEIYDSERCRPERFKKPYDPFYATADYNDYKANFEERIKTTGFNPRFVGPRLFRAMEDNQLYVHPHLHTHQMIRDRFARIDADLRKDEELDAEFRALEGYDD